MSTDAAPSSLAAFPAQRDIRKQSITSVAAAPASARQAPVPGSAALFVYFCQKKMLDLQLCMLRTCVTMFA